MPQSLAQVYLHIVFSTKGRAAFLQNEELRGEMHSYLAGICKRMGSPPLKVGGAADHVHIACRLSRKVALVDFLQELKKDSSKWVKRRDRSLWDFYWQAGYGAFSVSPGHVAKLCEYIENQEEHHRTETFQEELRRLLKLNGVAYDERYVWD